MHLEWIYFRRLAVGLWEGGTDDCRRPKVHPAYFTERTNADDGNSAHVEIRGHSNSTQYVDNAQGNVFHACIVIPTVQAQCSQRRKLDTLFFIASSANVLLCIIFNCIH